MTTLISLNKSNDRIMGRQKSVECQLTVTVSIQIRQQNKTGSSSR